MKLKENKKMTSDRAHLSHVNLGERCKQRKKEEKNCLAMSTLIDRLSGGLPIRVDCDEEEAKKETGQKETQKTRLDFGT